ncbi:TniQ family protein [Gordoniibacillus kamchatkensis]|uniref:TniQ family protein n=1 Tax=Gordoniibacillus kamchatkensis TaxID=1590651 RepID=UPI0009E3B18A
MRVKAAGHNSSVNVIQKNLNVVAIRNTMKAFCPLCLKDKLYYRKVWDLSIYTRCYIHNCILLSSCAICGRRITITDIINDLCKCGCKLSSISTVAMSAITFAKKEKGIFHEKSANP